MSAARTLIDMGPLKEASTLQWVDDDILEGDDEQFMTFATRLANSIFSNRTAVLAWLAKDKTDEDLLREAGQKLLDDIFFPLADERETELQEEAARAAAAWRAYRDPRPAPEGNPPLADWRQENAYLLNDPCAYCGGAAGTLDHIVPRFSGGANLPDNATAACSSCNSSKGTWPLLIWLARRQR